MAYTLQQVYQDALDAGLDDEGARAAVSVAATEGALNGEVGDGGLSHGPFQFHEQGELPGFAGALGTDAATAAQVAASRPDLASRYALSGYLGQTIRAGQQRGLSGPALAAFAQRYGQRSQDPDQAGVHYAQLFGGSGGQSMDPNQVAQPPVARMSRTHAAIKQQLDAAQSEQEQLQQRLAQVKGVVAKWRQSDMDDSKLTADEQDLLGGDPRSAQRDAQREYDAAVRRTQAAQTALTKAQEDDEKQAQTASGPNRFNSTSADAQLRSEDVNRRLDQTEARNDAYMRVAQGRLTLDQQNAEVNRLKTLYEAGKIPQDEALTALHEVLAMPAVATVNGQRYISGWEPGGAMLGLGKMVGLNFQPRPALDFDIDKVLGTHINPGLYGGSYAFGHTGPTQNQVQGMQSGFDAGQVLRPDANGGLAPVTMQPPGSLPPQGASPDLSAAVGLRAANSAAMGAVPNGPTGSVAQAGSRDQWSKDALPGGWTPPGNANGPQQSDVQTNESQPSGSPPVALGPPAGTFMWRGGSYLGGPSQASVQSNEQPPSAPISGVGSAIGYAGDQGSTPPQPPPPPPGQAINMALQSIPGAGQAIGAYNAYATQRGGQSVGGMAASMGPPSPIDGELAKVEAELQSHGVSPQDAWTQARRLVPSLQQIMGAAFPPQEG